MTVIAVDKDLASLTMLITAQFDAPIERIWQLWADPRQLERWWGPPMYPATFVDHDLVPGGEVTYFMTGPEGDTPHGWWRVRSVDSPHHLEFEDGFANDLGVPDPDMPTTITHVTLVDFEGGTRMAISTTFPSDEAMAQMIEMGVEEGMAAAVGQIDALLD
jgi:uncharacterized protein YndB with AHSA1/START domain